MDCNEESILSVAFRESVVGGVVPSVPRKPRQILVDAGVVDWLASQRVQEVLEIGRRLGARAFDLYKLGNGHRAPASRCPLLQVLLPRCLVKGIGSQDLF